MALLVFAIALFAAVLLSCLASRSVLSVAVLFLVAGFLAGPSVLGVLAFKATDPLVSRFVELALFSVLFTDGLHLGIRELSEAWHLPGRALLIGMPVTLALTAVLAHVLLGLGWGQSFLIGAVLSPTDPVFASAILGREEVPARLRNLLNVESGFNDGLALPLVVGMLGVAGAAGSGLGAVLAQVALGIALGIAVPWAAIRLERSRFFGASLEYQPLTAFTVGLLILAITSVTHANQFLAAFAGGIAVASASKEVRDAFQHFGALLAELFKLAALLVFGALIRPHYATDIGWTGLLFAVLALVAVRPAAMLVALFRSSLDWPEWVAAAWFGPKGFSSVFFSILVLQAEVPQASLLFHLLAVVIVLSMLAHSSTDVVVARWFRKAERA